MKTLNAILILACAALAPALFASTSITSDITTDTTWNNAGSPYILNAATITVDSGATLTIDTSGGNVVVEYGGSGYDFQIGSGSGDEGFLHLDASSGSITFRLRQNCNLVIDDYGQVLTTDTTGVTYFENYDPTKTNAGEYDWGGIDFIAGQQYQSHLVNIDVTGGGNDGKDGALVVRDTEDNTPLLEDLTFDDCNVSAIRFDGNGINTLRQDGLKLPFSVTSTDYVFYLNAVTSTVPIRFPDLETPDTPENKLSGTCTVGDNTNVSHWRFQALYTFKCVASSRIDVDNGSIWGVEGRKPTFRSISTTPGANDWAGLHDVSSTKANISSSVGAFAFLEVMDSSYGVYVSKGTSESVLDGLVYGLIGLRIRHCNTGIHANIPTGGSTSGTLTISECTIGGATTGEGCQYCIYTSRGNLVQVHDSYIIGPAGSFGTGVYCESDVTVEIARCRITGTFLYGIQATSNSDSDTNITVSRTIVSSNGFYGVDVYAGSSNSTVTANLQHSYFRGSAYGVSVGSNTSGVVSTTIEDCTFTEANLYGVFTSNLDISDVLVLERCNFDQCSLIAVGINATGSSAECYMEACLFTANGIAVQNVGTGDARLWHCNLIGNGQGISAPSGPFIDAEYCYWGAESGPSGGGPGSGDSVSATYVDYTPFLKRPYVDVLIGGCPAGASEWDVWENSTTNGDNLHIKDNTPYFKWTFASDFDSDTQSAYEIEVDNDLDFSSTLWDTTKTASSSAVYIEYAGSALTEGTIYYARIRLWNDEDLPGPWRYLTFRLNTAPAAVGITSRTPGDTDGIDDATPILQWLRPTDADEDPVHFLVEIDENNSFNNGAGEYRSLDSATDPQYFEISHDAGSTWNALPSDGVPAGDDFLVRAICPSVYPNTKGQLADDTWYWRITAKDEFESTSASATWSFTLGEEYVLTGRLYLANGTAAGASEVVKVAYNGSVLGDSGTTDSNGDFTITTNAALLVGEPLVFFHDAPGAGEMAGRVTLFAGQDMSGLDLRYKRVYVDGTADDPVSNEDFDDDDGVDADIPWTTDAQHAVAFDADLDGSSNGVRIQGYWELSEDVTWLGDSNGDEEFSIDAGARLRSVGHTLTLIKLVNSGALEILGGGTLLLTETDSTSSGLLRIIDSNLEMRLDLTGISLDITNGEVYIRNSAVIDGQLGISTLTVTGGVLECIDTEFTSVLFEVGTAGVVTAFNGNTFLLSAMSYTGYLIKWETQDYASISTMRGISFDANISSGAITNVESTNSSVPLEMIGCTGEFAGEQFDKNGGSEGDTLDNRVLWETVPPPGLSLLAGDTRVRIEWTDVLDSDQGFQDSGTATGVTATVLTDTGASWTVDKFIGMSLRMGTNAGNYKYYPITDNDGTTITINGSYSLTSDGWSVSSAYRISANGYNIYRSTTEGGTYSKINAEAVHGGTVYVDASLTNGTTYWYYIKTTTLGGSPVESGQSARKSSTPDTADIEALSPTSAAKGEHAAVSVIGENTHWAEGDSVLSYTGSNVTINDTLYISPRLALTDLTLAADATSGDIDVDTDDLWQITAYDESVSDAFTANNADADIEDRPTLVFSTNNSGIAADTNTSGSFTLNLDFTDNDNGIDTSSLEVFASRGIDAYFSGSSSPLTAGTELVGAGVVIETLSDSVATWTIEQAQAMNGDEDFANGEYTIRARIADDSGFYSEWATIRFYVEGADASVITVDDDGSGDPVYLLQGSTMDVDLSGSSLSSTQTISFGAGVTVNSATGSGSSITVNVTVAETADCGPRTFTTNNGSKSGIAIVEYPTNILPTVTNAEPSRNPAIGGVNVFLKNGAFFKSETDIAVRGRMMGMSWSRFYRSDITNDGPLGHGWVGHYFQRVVYEFDSPYHRVHWYTPDGRKETFTISGASGASSSIPVGVYVRAERETTFNTIVLTDRHGYACVFNADGRLWKCIDRNGNSTECVYNYAGQLVQIINDLGETFDIDYFDHGRVQYVTDNMWDNNGGGTHDDPRVVEYVYDSEGNLVEQKAPETERYDDTGSNRTTYGYQYDDQHRLTACINPREFDESDEPISYLENFYDSSDRVIDQRLGSEADVLDTHITKSAFIRLRYESSTIVHELDRAGHWTKYTLFASGTAQYVDRKTGFYNFDTDEPIDHTESTGISTALAKLRSGDPSQFRTDFTYNSNHEILTILYPRGNKVAYEYSSGSLIAEKDGSETVTVSGQDLTIEDPVFDPGDVEVGQTLRMGDDVSDYKYYVIVSKSVLAGPVIVLVTAGTGFNLQDDGWGTGDTYAIFDGSPDPMAAGNVLSVTRSDEGLGALADIVTTYTYEPRYQFVKTVTDPRGNTTTYTYDYEKSAANGADAGNLVEVTSPDIDAGQPATQIITSRTTYNQYGQPVTMTDGEGNVSYFVYYTTGDNNGFLKQRISAYGELNLTSEYEYDPVGNLTASWSPRAFDLQVGEVKDDFKTAYEVNALNQIWHVTSKYEVGDELSSTLASVDSYRYFDLNGNLTQSFREYVTDAGTGKTNPSGGNEHDPTWFAGQKSSSAMAATWVETSAEYNLLNYAHSRTVDAIAGSSVTQYTSRTEFDSNYNAIASISPLGNRSHTVYDERDLVYQRIAGAESDVMGTFETDYDANGNVSKSRDALGNESTYTYDGFDRSTQRTDPAGNYSTTTYDANSNALTSSAYDSFNTLLAYSESTYDQVNRAYTSRRLANDHNGVPIGDGWNTSTTLLDKNSRVVSSTNDNGVTHYNFYDGANRTTYTRDAIGNESHFTYNANSATTKVDYLEVNGLNGALEKSHVTYVLNRSDVAWEVQDRRWGEYFDTSGYTRRDGWGRVTYSVDAGGNGNTVNYDLLSRTTDSTEEAGTDDIFTMFTYDDDSRTTARAIKRNPGASTFQTTEYIYDERNRLITLRRPDGDIWNFKYDENSNRIGWDDPLGTRVTDTYDERNLISYRNIERGTGIVGTDYESYEFDGLRRLQSCSNYADGELISASAWEYNTQSQPEVHDQTIADYQGNILGTWTTGAEYDATGFNTATIYSNGRVVRHGKDQLDRLLESYDEDNNVSIATYVYRGPRSIIERTYGNGTRTSYTYESSGCGCGGSTSFIERVAHTEISNGRVLWATDRRYDERGLVMVESRDHEGMNGVVFRYDEAERLTETYYGVDLSGPDLVTFSNDAVSPSTFGKKTSYDLDPRGNRDSVVDSDDSPGTIYDYSYTENTDTNQYTDVDGASYTYDAIEQMTDDPTRNLDFEYDYKGQLVTEDNDADNPERRYSYDCQGRRKTEQGSYEVSGSYEAELSVLISGVADWRTCSGTAGDQALEEFVYAGDGSLMFSSYFSFGPGAFGGLSGNVVHPATAATTIGGSIQGPTRILEFIDPATGSDKWRYRYEDQLGSLIGMADEDTAKLADYVYLDYGRAVERRIAFDGDHDDVNEGSTTHSTPNTTITISGASFTTDEFKGMQLAVAKTSNGEFYVGTVQSNTSTTIVVEDASQNIIDRIKMDDLNFVIYDFVDTNVATSGTYHTAGEWTSAPNYDEVSRTLLTDTGADFKSYMVGWLISLRVQEFNYLEITEYVSATQIKVKGDAEDLALATDRYWLFAPPHVNPATGAMRGSYTLGTFEPECDTHYLWGLYRYMPPMVGFQVDPDGISLGTYGAQTGANKAGHYHAGARVYDPSIGRWTTPDPAMTPWWNILIYGCGSPLMCNDPSGLQDCGVLPNPCFCPGTSSGGSGGGMGGGGGGGGGAAVVVIAAGKAAEALVQLAKVVDGKAGEPKPEPEPEPEPKKDPGPKKDPPDRKKKRGGCKFYRYVGSNWSPPYVGRSENTFVTKTKSYGPNEAQSKLALPPDNDAKFIVEIYCKNCRIFGAPHKVDECIYDWNDERKGWDWHRKGAGTWSEKAQSRTGGGNEYTIGKAQFLPGVNCQVRSVKPNTNTDWPSGTAK